jgi:quercetin dioxygenase-like cupin family protein
MSTTGPPQSTAIPADDPARTLTVALPDTDVSLPHVAIAGDTYTIVVAGNETAGQFTLIDMLIPPGGGPPPHRHDFEEMFTLLEGEIEFTFRGDVTVAQAGATINIPANAPHHFRNASDSPARLLCTCSPSGQEEFFLEVGDRVADRTSPPPSLTESEQATRRAHATALAPHYRTELLMGKDHDDEH